MQPGTGRRGYLDLNIDVQPHLIWHLDGDQLRADLPVALDELALGAVVNAVTPDSEVRVNIPAGTSPGQSLRLHLPRRNNFLRHQTYPPALLWSLKLVSPRPLPTYQRPFEQYC